MPNLKLTLILVLLCFSFYHHLSAQETTAEQFTISGYIEDTNSGEKLIGANVFDPKKGIGTSTNTYGFFSLTLPKDSVYLAISYIGYETKFYSLYLDKDVSLNFTLSEGNELATVEVVAEDLQKIEDEVQMSRVEVPIKQIKRIPALLGEVDVLKSLQLLPGVQSGGEGTSGLYVRGGSPDQNLVLLDGVPVYNVSHLFGFFSVFNADAIKSVALTKGGFPARYGGRLSSVLEINMKEGNMKEFHGEGSVGLISSKLTLEGPIIKDKTSFIISGRRTYIDLLARPFIRQANQDNDTKVTPAYFFYDVNAKINHKFSDKDRLFLSFYGGDDVFKSIVEESNTNQEFKLDAGLDWGNRTSSLRWNHLWNNKLFSNTTLTYSRYNFAIGQSSETTNLQTDSVTNFVAKYFSGIEDIGGKIDFDYVVNPQHYVRFGANMINHTFSPGALQYQSNETGENVDTTVGSQRTRANEFAIYIEDDMTLFGNLKMNAGLHYSGFLVDGEFYNSLQPRLGLNYKLPQDLALKASFATMTQYIHLLTNEGLGLPTDLWVPTTKNIIPEQSWQVALGFAKTFNKDIEISIEGYYKEMSNLVSYKEGASFIDNPDNDWESRVTQGDGDSYGVEFFLQKKKGKTTGWVGYTLSWTNRIFAEINNGEPYPFKYDRRHDISIVLSHEFTDDIIFSTTWVYGTGNSITLPESIHQGSYFYNFLDRTYGTSTYNIERASSKNSFRQNAYHRLDMGVEFNKDKGRYQRTWVVGVYNAYNRANPFFISQAFDDQGNRVFRQFALFPLIPSVAYRFKF